MKKKFYALGNSRYIVYTKKSFHSECDLLIALHGKILGNNAHMESRAS